MLAAGSRGQTNSVGIGAALDRLDPLGRPVVSLPDPVDRAVAPRPQRPVCGNSTASGQQPRPGGFEVLATTWARVRAVTAGGRPDRGLSRRPASPSSEKRRRRRLTWTTVSPVIRATSAPETSSALRSSTRARRLSPAGPLADRGTRSSATRAAFPRTIGREWLAKNPPGTACTRRIN